MSERHTDSFSLSASDVEGRQQWATENGISADQVRPGLFEGIGHALIAAPNQGIWAAAKGVGILATGATVAAEKAFGLDSSVSDTDFAFIDKHIGNHVDDLTPNALQTGKATQVVHGLLSGLAPLALGPEIGLPSMLASTQVETGTQLMEQGATPGTAVAAGSVATAANAIGFKIPIIGKTLLSRMATGAAGNLAVGAGSAAAIHEALRANGNADLAEQYNWADPEQRALDILMGLGFGGYEHLTAPKLTTVQTDAILALRNAKHFQQDSALGVPADMASSVQHQKAMEQAITQLMNDQSVEVADQLQDAAFHVKPVNQTQAQAVADAIQEIKPKEFDASQWPQTTPIDDLSIEQRFTEQLASDPVAAEAQYAALPAAKGGKVLNVDTARELSPDYLQDRTRSAAVHEPASALIKALYAKRLQEPPQPSERPLVLFTAGGTGAGKSTAIREALGPVADTAQIVYDTNMNGVESSIKKIDKALAAGKEVYVAYTFRDPIVALREGALSRAMGQEHDFGSGRTVPLKEHLRTHLGSRDAIEHITAHYAGDPRVVIRVVDNTGTKNAAKPSQLGKIPKFGPEAYNHLREEGILTINQERAAGRISESIARGFLADERGAAQDAAGPVRGPTDAGTGGQSQSQRPADQLDPQVSAAQQLVNESPGAPVLDGFDADGNPQYRKASDVMTDIQAQHAIAVTESKVYDVATTCLLKRGD